MGNVNPAEMIYLLLVLTLPLMALMGRRLSGQKTLRLAAIWIVIFLTGVLLVKFVSP